MTAPKANAPALLERFFIVGAKVHLRTCPYGQPGIVTGLRRGLVLVNWPDLGIAAVAYRPERLVIVEGGVNL
jgi:hypothetical protein